MVKGSNQANPAIVDVIKAETKNLNKISDYLKDYVVQLAKIAQSITTIDDANVKKLLQCIDENGQINMKGAGQLQMIKLIENMTKLIGTLPKSIDQLASIDLGWKTIIKVKKNLQALPDILSGIVSMIVNGFQQVLNSKEIEQMIDLLISKDMPEEGEFYENGRLKNGKKTFKKAGIVDTILGVFQIIGQLQTIQIPNMFKLYVAGKMTTKSLTIFMNQVAKELSPIVQSGDSKTIWEALGTAIETTRTLVNTLVDIEKILPTLTTSLKTFFRAKVFFRVMGFGTPENPGIMGIMFTLSTDTRLDSFKDGSVPKMLQGLEDMVSGLVTFSEKLGEFLGNWTKIVDAKKLLGKIVDDKNGLIYILEQICIKLNRNNNLFKRSKTSIGIISEMLNIFINSFATMSQNILIKYKMVEKIINSDFFSSVNIFIKTSNEIDRKKLKRISLIIQDIQTIFQQISILTPDAKYEKILNSSSKIIKQLAKTIPSLVEDINNLLNLGGTINGKINDIDKIFTNIKRCLYNVVKISKIIVSVSLWTLPVLMAIPIVILSIKVIISFVKKISTMLVKANIQKEILISSRVLKQIAAFLVFILLFETIVILTGILIVKNTLAFIAGLLAVIVLYTALLLTMFVINKISSIISKNRIALLKSLSIMNSIVMSIVLTTVAMVLMVLILQMIEWGDMLNSLGKFLVFLGAFVLIILGIGLLAPVLIAGSIALGVVSLALIMIVSSIIITAFLLKSLGSINFTDEDKINIKKCVNTIISTALDVVASIFSRDMYDPTQENADPKKTAMLGFFGMTGMIIKIIAASIFLMIATISIFFILLIVSMLKLIQSINLEEGTIKEKVGVVMRTAQYVIDSIFNPEENNSTATNKSWIRSVLEFLGVGPILKIIDAVMALAYLAITFFSILILTLIAANLRLLQEINLEEGTIKEKVSIVMRTAQSVIDSLFNPEENNSTATNKSWIRSVLEFLGVGPILKIIDAVMAIGYLAVTFFAILMLTFLAKELQYLSRIDIPSGIDQKCADIVFAAQRVIDAVMRRDESSPQPANKGIGKLLRFVLPDALMDMIDGLMSIGFLAVANVAIGMLKKLAEGIIAIKDFPVLTENQIKGATNRIINTSRIIIDAVFDEAGNVAEIIKDATKSEYCDIFLKILDKTVHTLTKVSDKIIQIGNMDPSTIQNATNIIQSVTKIPATMLKELPEKNIIKAGMNAFKVFMNRINDIIDLKWDQMQDVPINKINEFMTIPGLILTSISDASKLKKQLKLYKKIYKTLNLFDSIKFNNTDKIKSILSIPLIVEQRSIKNIDQMNKKIDLLNRLHQTLSNYGSLPEGQVKTHNKIINDYCRFLNKIQQVDIEKLKTTENVFAKLANFSESINGNFDKLADALNEKIAPLLEELKELMDGVQQKVEKTGADISSSVYASSRSSLSNEEHIAQVARENPNMSQVQQQQIATQRQIKDSRMKENADVADIYNLLVETGIKIRT